LQYNYIIDLRRKTMTNDTTVTITLSLRDLDFIKAGLDAITELDDGDDAAFGNLDARINALLPADSIYKD
jgi:hypothetical protein